MESFFDACLDRIVELIRGHLRQIEQVASGKPKATNPRIGLKVTQLTKNRICFSLADLEAPRT